MTVTDAAPPSEPHVPPSRRTPQAAARSWWMWLIVAGLTLGAVYLLRGVLLPFVAGAAVAYFLDPAADWLERRGLGRTVATVVITAFFVVLLAGALLLLIPALQHEISRFLGNLPGYAAALEERIRPLIEQARQVLPADQVDRLREGAGGMVGDAAGVAMDVLRQVLTSGLAILNVLGLLILTPVVAFYLLRDWDGIVAKVDGWLPRANAPTLRAMARDIDSTLAGFVRGQATVCLALGTFYAIGLSIVGLDLGLVVGLASGLLSFIPYVGSIAGFIASMGLAFAQFSDWTPIAAVAGIYIAGQALEGNVLSPWLVGERVGLHPVWVMFALLAAGSLFGFLGVLLAVPVAAIIGVVVRYSMAHYLDSRLYQGEDRAP
ncbi:AI-2E family transporter [Novispirillum sp. DQ9]|uniref:AI-2E family transporter n=1 Tax=Novispirillum sp. DQ9 TaxID=3398612 RepID=UPI003C7EB552